AVTDETDNCGVPVVAYVGDLSNGSTCPQVITRTYSVTDACLNQILVTQTITVDDTINPVASHPAPVLVQCIGDVPAPDIAAVTDETDNCGVPVVAYVGDLSNGSTCPQVITRTYSVTDACLNQILVTQTITVDDSIAPTAPENPEELIVECGDEVPAAQTLYATDNCGTPITGEPSDSLPDETDRCNVIITRTWTFTDACDNSSTATQTIRIVDTTVPEVTWPEDVNLTCADCDMDNLDLTGQPTVVLQGCDQEIAPTYEDVEDSGAGTCPRIVKRLWTVSDGCNEVTSEQTIQCLPTSEVVVTNSSLCTYDMDPSTECKDFRLLFTQDPQNFPKSKVTATNPGQTYYNLFYNGTAGSTVTFNITLPYPYVTQGAQPIHAYDGVTVRLENGEACYQPGRGFYVGSTQVMLDNYATQTYGSGTSLNVTLEVPSTGFIYLNIHLDFGLKRSSGYTANANGDAVDSNLAIVIPNRGHYEFTASSSGLTTRDGICNINVWKKLPGAGGFAGIPYTTPDGSTGRTPKAGCPAVLKDSKGLVLASGVTDEDGWYFCNYKWTGKQSTIFVTLTPPGSSPITRSATLKSNGYAQIDFDTR
ncbi:MAG: hypothetical protein V4675_17900, partial [Verrucomicrobiota bacterium]